MKIFITLFLLLCTSGTIWSQSKTAASPTRIAVLLYPGAELLDFAGPLEVFSLMPNAEVYTVAPKPGSLNTMKNMLKISPDYTITDAPQPDVLVVPGASPDPIRALLADSSVLNWIRRTTPNRQVTMSVCTGAYVLGRAGLLDHKTVTTHWAATEMLQRMMPKATVMEHTRFVVDGKLVTTAGVSAGIDGALRVVEQLRGRNTALDVARIMEYDRWNPELGFVVGKKLGIKPRTTPKRAAVALPKPVPVDKTPKPAALVMLASPVDPVCKMNVSVERADTTRYMGRIYGFCSKICKERFRRQPAAYVNPY